MQDVRSLFFPWIACVLLSGCTPSSSTTQQGTGDPTSTGGASEALVDAGTPEASAPVAERTESPADASAPEAAAPDAATAPTYVGLRTLTLRAGARPPRGAQQPHGREAWSVMLAVSSGSTPELTALFQQATALRLGVSTGELRCTPPVGGALPESVPQGDGAMQVEVSFRTERDARAFAAALTEPPLWVGRVRTMCAD
jgi:hypothetical protein